MQSDAPRGTVALHKDAFGIHREVYIPDVHFVPDWPHNQHLLSLDCLVERDAGVGEFDLASKMRVALTSFRRLMAVVVSPR